MMKMLDEMRALEEAGEDDAEPFLQLEADARAALRAAIKEQLQAASLPEMTIFTVLGRVELGFTAADHSTDLSGEKFIVSVKLPGTIVSGNYDAIEQDAAKWAFEAEAFRDRDQVLRVISIVE